MNDYRPKTVRDKTRLMSVENIISSAAPVSIAMVSETAREIFMIDRWMDTELLSNW